MKSFKPKSLILSVFTLIFLSLHSIAFAVANINVYVVKDGSVYNSQGIVDLINNGGYLWVKDTTTYTDRVKFTSSLLSPPDSTTVELGLLISGYGESVDYWLQGATYTYSDTLDVSIAGGGGATIYCYLKSDAEVPVTDLDLPLAIIPSRSNLAWGPEGFVNGVQRLYSGEFTEHAIDLSVAGKGLDVVFGRRYMFNYSDNSIIGNNWGFSYDISLPEIYSTPNSVKGELGNGRIIRFEDAYDDLGVVSDGDLLTARRPYTADKWSCLVGITFNADSFIRFEDGSLYVFDNIYYSGELRNKPKEIRDRNGNTIDLTYDGNNNLTKITDTLEREYDLLYYTTGVNTGLLKTITEADGLGRVVEYLYYVDADSGGSDRDLEEVITRNSGSSETRSVSYTYVETGNNKGKLLTITDAKGEVVLTNVYNSSGQVTKQTLANNSVTNYTYESVTENVDIGDATSTTVDVVSQTIVKDGAGLVSLYQFDEDDRLIRRRDYTGNAGTGDIAVTSAQASSLTGQLRTNSSPQDTITSNWDDPLYYDTTYDWNSHDDLTEIANSGGVHTVFNYSSDVSINPLERSHATVVKQYENGSAVNYIQTENRYFDPGNGLHMVQYQDMVEDTGTITTTFTRDTDGNVTNITYPDTSEENFTYYGDGLIDTHTTDETVIDESGTTGNIRTDKLVYTFAGDGSYTVETKLDYNGSNESGSTNAYDLVGRLISTTDARKNVWNYAYTLFDQLETVTEPAPGFGVNTSPKTIYTYDDNNNLEYVTSNNVNHDGSSAMPIATSFEYDELNRHIKTINDANGLAATTVFEYDEISRLTKVITPEASTGSQSANITEYEYDERSFLYKSIRGNGEETTAYGYDAFGNLESTISADDELWSSTYDNYGRLLTSTNPYATVTTIDDRNKRGLVEEFHINGLEKPSGSTIELARTNTEYDSLGRVTNIKQNADTVGITYNYTLAGQLWKTTDPLSRESYVAYDSRHRLDYAVDALGNKVAYTYDINSNVQKVTQTDIIESSGLPDTPMLTSFGYDNLNRRVTTTDMASNTTQTRYDSLGRVRKTIDAKNHFVTYGYNNLSQPTYTKHYASGASIPTATTRDHYDLNGRLIGRSDPKNYRTSYVYDHLDRQTDIVYADGSSESVLSYDAMQRPLTVRKQDGTVYTNTYNSIGQLTDQTTTTASGVMAVHEDYEYDGLGRLTQQQAYSTSADTLATKTAYDYNDTVATPTLTKTITLGGLSPKTITKTYNHSGELSQIAQPNSRTLNYSHNDAGQLSGIDIGATNLVDIQHIGGRRDTATMGTTVFTATKSYDTDLYGLRVSGTSHVLGDGTTSLDNRTNTWDSNYNRTSRSITGGSAHSYVYDELDRMTSGTNGTYTLDDAGNRTDTGYAMEGTGGLLNQYSSSPGEGYGHDPAGRLTARVTDNTTYIYDALGRLKELRTTSSIATDTLDASLPAGAQTLSGTWSVANDYLEETSVGAGRILWTPSDEVEEFSFSYWSGADPDSVSNYAPEYYAQVVLRATETVPASGIYNFLALSIQPDGLYLREWHGETVTELGGLEISVAKELWHRLSVSFTGTGGTTVVVKHVLDGASESESLTATTTLASTASDQIGFGVGGKADFRFDDFNYRMDVSSATTALRYHYDAHGRVTGHTLDPDGTPTTRYYIYDNDRIIQELDGNGDLVAAWDYGLYVDEILAMHRDTDDDHILDTTYYYLQDDHYNVVGLTDDTGALVESYSYDDYGVPSFYDATSTIKSVTESDYNNPFLFTGRRYDATLGLYDYRTRYYDPQTGRFLRIDTIGTWGDSNNLGNAYAYVGNNPWTNLDPYGEGPFYDEHLSPEALRFKRDVFIGTFKGAGRAAYGLGEFTYNATGGTIYHYTGSPYYAHFEEPGHQIVEGFKAFIDAPVDTISQGVSQYQDDFTQAILDGDGHAAGDKVGAGAFHGIVLGDAAAGTVGAVADGLATRGAVAINEAAYSGGSAGVPLYVHSISTTARVTTNNIAGGVGKTAGKGTPIKRNPIPKGFHDHHILSDKNSLTKNHELLKLADFNLQSRVNKIYLPTTGKLHPTRSIHLGRHRNIVSKNLAGQMDDIVSLGKVNGFTQSQYSNALRTLIAQERQMLRGGQRALNKNARPGAH